jgi:hypothetical protein
MYKTVPPIILPPIAEVEDLGEVDTHSMLRTVEWTFKIKNARSINLKWLAIFMVLFKY